MHEWCWLSTLANGNKAFYKKFAKSTVLYCTVEVSDYDENRHAQGDTKIGMGGWAYEKDIKQNDD